MDPPTRSPWWPPSLPLPPPADSSSCVPPLRTAAIAVITFAEVTDAYVDRYAFPVAAGDQRRREKRIRGAAFVVTYRSFQLPRNKLASTHEICVPRREKLGIAHERGGRYGEGAFYPGREDRCWLAAHASANLSLPYLVQTTVRLTGGLFCSLEGDNIPLNRSLGVPQYPSNHLRPSSSEKLHSRGNQGENTTCAARGPHPRRVGNVVGPIQSKRPTSKMVKNTHEINQTRRTGTDGRKHLTRPAKSRNKHPRSLANPSPSSVILLGCILVACADRTTRRRTMPKMQGVVRPCG